MLYYVYVSIILNSITLYLSWGTLCIGSAASKRSFLGHVLRFFCVLQLSRCRSQWNCYINDVFWMLGFARNIVFLGKRRLHCGERLAGLGFGKAGAVSLCRRILFDLREQFPWGLQVTFSLLCWCCAFVQFSLCRSQWLAASHCCRCMRNTIVFAAESRA